TRSSPASSSARTRRSTATRSRRPRRLLRSRSPRRRRRRSSHREDDGEASVEHRLIVAQPAWGEPGAGALAVGVMPYLATHEGRTTPHLGLVVKVSLAYALG